MEYNKSFKTMFEEVLNKFEKDDSGAVMAALAYVNEKYIELLDEVDESITSVTELGQHLLTNIFEFGEYFLTNYGEETADDGMAMFNDQEPLVIDAYVSAGLEIVESKMLEIAEQNMTKKVQFDLNNLKRELAEIASEYENVYLEKQGHYTINNNLCEVSGYYEYNKDDDSEEYNNFLKTFLFTEGSVLFIQCDNNTRDGIIYAMVASNHSWKSISADSLKDIISELSDEDMAELGYKRLICAEIKKNF